MKKDMPTNKPKKEKREKKEEYEPPKLMVVEILPEETFLAICKIGTDQGPQLICSVCYSVGT
jgi:hypothetical protein